jgi:hypothetical protein
MNVKRNRPAQPDYAFWDKLGKFQEWQVTCLWCEIEPSIAASLDGKPAAFRQRLIVARKDGFLKAEVKKVASADGMLYELWYRRKVLKDFAKRILEKPKFLFAKSREIAGEAKAHQSATSRSRVSTTDAAVVAESLPAGDIVIDKTVKHEDIASEINGTIPPLSAYLTIKQLSIKQPAFSESALRNLINKAKPTQSSKGEIPGNGLDSAIIRIGRKVLFDEEKFLSWVKSNQ